MSSPPSSSRKKKKICEECNVAKATKKAALLDGSSRLLCVPCLNKLNDNTESNSFNDSETSSRSSFSTKSNDSPRPTKSKFRRAFSKSSLKTSTDSNVPKYDTRYTSTESNSMSPRGRERAPSEPVSPRSAVSMSAIGRARSSNAVDTSSRRSTSAVASKLVSDDAVLSRSKDQEKSIRSMLKFHQETVVRLEQMKKTFEPLYQSSADASDSLQSALSTHKQEILNLQKALEDLSLLTKRELEQVSVARQKLEKEMEAEEKIAAARAAEQLAKQKARDEEERKQRAERAAKEAAMAEERAARRLEIQKKALQAEQLAAQPLTTPVKVVDDNTVRRAARRRAQTTTSRPIAQSVDSGTTSSPTRSPRGPLRATSNEGARSPPPPRDAPPVPAARPMATSPEHVANDALSFDDVTKSSLNASLSLHITNVTDSVQTSPYAPLLRLLPGSSLLIVNAMLLPLERDKQAVLLSSVLCAFDGHGLLRQTLLGGIANEVKGTDAAPQMFRANTIIARLISSYVQEVGTSVLRNALLPLITELRKNKINLEVDPHQKLFQPNAIHDLKHWAKRFLDKIKLTKWPIGLRWLAKTIRTCSLVKFPNSGQAAVAGCLFLRFVCPALAVPQMRGILRNRTSHRTQRALVLISKVLQSLANGAVSKKEPYMAPIGEFISAETPSLLEFYDEFVNIDEKQPLESISTLKEAESLHLPLIHAVIVQQKSKIDASLLSYKQNDTVSALNDCLPQLPPEPTTLDRLFATASSQSDQRNTPPACDDDVQSDDDDAGEQTNASSPSGGFVLGPNIDVTRGCELCVVWVGDSASPSVTLKHRVEFTTSIESFINQIGKELKWDEYQTKCADLYSITPVDAKLKREKTISTYHYLVKNPNVELRLAPDRFSSILADNDLELCAVGLPDRIKQLKMSKMKLVGAIAKKDERAMAELKQVDARLKSLENVAPRVSMKKIERPASATARPTPPARAKSPGPPPRAKSPPPRPVLVASPRSRRNVVGSAASSASSSPASPARSPRRRLPVSPPSSPGRARPHTPASPPPTAHNTPPVPRSPPPARQSSSERSSPAPVVRMPPRAVYGTSQPSRPPPSRPKPSSVAPVAAVLSAPPIANTGVQRRPSISKRAKSPRHEPDAPAPLSAPPILSPPPPMDAVEPPAEPDED